MRNFYSAAPSYYDFPKQFRAANPGNPIKTVFESYYDGTTIKLRELGTRNIQEAIDLEAPYSDLEYMLNKLKLGDTSVLTVKQPIYGDFSQLPKNPIDVINIVRSAEEYFQTLPAETQHRYNNDWRSWLTWQMEFSGESITAPEYKHDVSRNPNSEVATPTEKGG